MADLKCPWPYFGGKRRAASLVWSRLGDISNYIEPFAGSAAMLLCRPSAPKIETLNDLDCYVANFWRATQADPDAVAEFADGPVNECDLHARHRWLVTSPAAAEFRERMRADPDYFDAKVAGWWCWGLCCWIGSGWCGSGDRAASEKMPLAPRASGGRSGGNSAGVHAEQGPTLAVKRPLPAGAADEHGERTCQGLGVHAKWSASWDQRPDLLCGNGKGCGVHRPQLADQYARGRGVHADPPGEGLRQTMPRLGGYGGEGSGTFYGSGVHSNPPGMGLSQPMPALSPGGKDGGTKETPGYKVHGRCPPEYATLGTCAARRAWLRDWFGRLRDRLRTVRVCCGDWRRVCDSESVTTRLGLTGIFLDPPYSTEAGRTANLYGCDSGDVARAVRAYCLERGDDPRMRIALAGYAGEGHEELEAHGWTRVAWKAAGGYGNRSENGKANAARERIWFSPHCLDPGRESMPLFAGLAADAPDPLGRPTTFGLMDDEELSR